MGRESTRPTFDHWKPRFQRTVDPEAVAVVTYALGLTPTYGFWLVPIWQLPFPEQEE